jgi:hypothetical protein
MPRPLRQHAARAPRASDPLLGEVLAALPDTAIRETQIREDGLLVFGAHDVDGSISLNVPLLRVLVALHELVHHVRPSWSERYVQAKGWQLLHMLSDEEVGSVNADLMAQIRATSRADRRAAA